MKEEMKPEEWHLKSSMNEISQKDPHGTIGTILSIFISIDNKLTMDMNKNSTPSLQLFTKLFFELSDDQLGQLNSCCLSWPGHSEKRDLISPEFFFTS